MKVPVFPGLGLICRVGVGLIPDMPNSYVMLQVDDNASQERGRKQR